MKMATRQVPVFLALLLLPVAPVLAQTATPMAPSMPATPMAPRPAPMATTPAMPASTPAAAADYVSTAGASDLFEKTSSQWVLRSTRNANVRRFAEMMISDHAKTTAQVKVAAKTARVPAPSPAMTAEQQGMIDSLRGAPAAQRDKMYMDQQVAAHQRALAVHQGYAASGDNDALKKVANGAVPIVQKHLAEAQRLDASM